jgi:hypothetical protein
MGLSVPFLMAGLKHKIKPKAARWAGWILVLYPEGILLGASQMREPFMILFFTMMFWAASRWLDDRHNQPALITFAFSAIGMLLFSFRVGLPMIGLVLIGLWVVESTKLRETWLKIVGWAVIAGAVLIGAWLMRDWVAAVLHWDTLQTIVRSGRVQFHLGRLPGWLHFPFIMIYGLLQPVLPAAIVAPASWVWKSLAIFRALGWYLLFPFLVYALILVWRFSPSNKRRALAFLVLIFCVWVFIASARAGGDQWDNPRYRTVFLPWMAVVAGWGLTYAAQIKDRWLGRIFVIEGIFLVFFTQWYISRYNPSIPRLELGAMTAIILVLSLIIIVGGWFKDHKHNQQSLMQDQK